MAEETKNDNFEDSFENDEFDFLEEDEIKTEPTATAASVKKSASSSGFPIKPLIIAGGIITAGIFVFHTMHNKKTQQSPDFANDAATSELTKKNEQNVTVQIKQPNEALKNAAANVSPINNTNIPVSTANNTSPPSSSANQTTDPELTKMVTTTGEEKSREEMADLFATTNVNQTNNLEKVVAQQNKETATNPQNMDLYFGSNTPHNKIDKTTAKEKDEKDKDNKASIQLQRTVESMTQEITENVNQIKQLEDKLNELTKLLSKVNQNIGAMDSRMLGLTESVDSLTQDVSNVKKVIADEDLDLTANANKPATEAQLTYKPPGYSIHAIIPGRAWLKSSSGQIITVAEGDTVGDYGTVAVIDAANNIVRTSSGVSFR